LMMMQLPYRDRDALSKIWQVRNANIEDNKTIKNMILYPIQIS